MPHPYMSDPYKKARCGMCMNFMDDYDERLTYDCRKEHNLKYPLIAYEHNCKDYEFNPNPIDRYGQWLREESFHAKLLFTYCPECTFEFGGLCSGKKWIPVKVIDGKCEFFKPRAVACKNCVPTLQYGNCIRNNYCKLPPHLRHGDQSRGWKWMCPEAHDPDKARWHKCYKPIQHEKEI